MAKESGHSPQKLSPSRLKKLHKACAEIRAVCNPLVAFAGDEEIPPETLSTEECLALHDTIQALQAIYLPNCPSA